MFHAKDEVSNSGLLSNHTLDVVFFLTKIVECLSIIYLYYSMKQFSGQLTIVIAPIK